MELAPQSSVVPQSSQQITATQLVSSQPSPAEPVPEETGADCDAPPPQELYEAPGPYDEDALGTENVNTNLKFCLHPDDPANFLKLSTALIILTKTSITSEELVVADNLLREYCTELITVSTVLIVFAC
jgi:hypothetical protein